MKIVITGGIAGGKSTATRIFQQELKNFHFFDYDQTVHSLYESPEVQAELIQAVGTSDRKQLSTLAHSRPEVMVGIRSVMDNRLITAIQQASVRENVFFDLPLYFEFAGSISFTPDFIICVTASREQQIKRIKLRNGWDDDKIATVLANQMPMQDKVDKSHFILHNDFDGEEGVSKFNHYVRSFIRDFSKLIPNQDCTT